MRHASRSREAGFSFIELMVAMTVTLIVSGAIYGLLATGKSAFRREPELSDRQQNIRIAMSMIEHDVLAAGDGLPAFTQVFMLGGDAGLPPALDPYGTRDVLEMVVLRDNCPTTPACTRADSGSLVSLSLMVDLPACFEVPRPATGVGPGLGSGPRMAAWVSLNAALQPSATVVGPLTNDGNPGAVCSGSTTGTIATLDTGAGPAEWRPAAGVPATPSTTQLGWVVPVDVVRYQITNDAEGVPCLWRSATGGRGPADAPPYGTLNDPPGTMWQMVARGIENLQVTYTDGSGGPFDEPRTIVVGDYSTLVRQVQVTLQARVTAALLAGGTTSTVFTDAPDAIRGQLTTQITPRGALVALQAAAVPDAQKWR